MIIVASGPSARDFVAPDNIPVIAVNGAIDWLNRADYWFSLDPTLANRNRAMNRRAGVDYHVAFNRYYIRGIKNYERISRRGEQPFPRGTPEWWFWRWHCVAGICKEPGYIHSGNSAWGALQIAYKLGARKVILIGVDATREERIEGGRPLNLSHLPLLFESALPDMQIVNCGRMQSKLPTMTISEGIEWLR